MAVNVVYLRALGLEGLAATTTPASKAAAFMFGALGDRFVTAAIAISTFGFLDLAILAPTRVYYAMAADRVFLPALSRLHPTYQTPWIAIVIQSTWSCVLALTGRYEQLLNYVVFADWIFFGLTVATLSCFAGEPSAVGASRRNFPRAGLSARADRVRRRRRWRRAERRARRPVKRLARRGCSWPLAFRCSTGSPALTHDPRPSTGHSTAETAESAERTTLLCVSAISRTKTLRRVNVDRTRTI